MTGWFKFVLINSILNHWTSATDIDGRGQIQETLKVLQSTVEDLKNNVLISNQRNDHIEVKLSESREKFKQLKIQYDRNIHELEARMRELEVAGMKRDRQVIALRRDKEEDRKYIDKLEQRLAKLEKKHEVIFENACQLQNCSTNIASENTPSSTNSKGERIQKRLLSPPSNTQEVIAFYAYMSTILLSPSARHVLVFDVVGINTRKAYRPTTGKFKVPESGVYVFTWTFRTGGNRYHSIQLMKNAEDFGSMYLHPVSGAEIEETGIVVIYANAGDDVYVRTHTSLPLGPSHYIQSDTYGRSSFAGWKLF